MSAPETSQWVVISGAVAAVSASLLLISERVRLIVAPFFRWWATRAERRAIRQAEIDASLLIRNDQRIVALTQQVEFLAAELVAARSEVAALRSELAAYRAGGGAV